MPASNRSKSPVSLARLWLEAYDAECTRNYTKELEIRRKLLIERSNRLMSGVVQ